MIAHGSVASVPLLALVLPGVLLPVAAAPRGDATVAAIEAHQQQLFERVAPAVVFIAVKDGFGSGFFVNRKGLVLTNAHVVGKRDQVDVVTHDGRRLRGRVVERGADDVDVALVQVDVSSTPALKLGGVETLRVGSWVASVGHGMGGIWTFTTGMVSNIYPAGSEKPVFQTQIPLNPGNSGGPVFDRRGRVVGVVTSGIMESNAINFAIRIDKAVSALDKLATQGDVLVVEAPDGVPVFVDGTMVGKGPRVALPVAAGKHEVFCVVKGKMRKRKISYPGVKRVDLR